VKEVCRIHVCSDCDGSRRVWGKQLLFFGFFVRENVVQEIVFRPDVACLEFFLSVCVHNTIDISNASSFIRLMCLLTLKLSVSGAP